MFAPAARLRPRLVQPPSSADAAGPASHDDGRLPARRRLEWALLLRRVFAAEALVCPACGSPMRVIAHIERPDVAARPLRHLGLPADAPTPKPARGPPETEPSFDLTA